MKEPVSRTKAAGACWGDYKRSKEDLLAWKRDMAIWLAQEHKRGLCPSDLDIVAKYHPRQDIREKAAAQQNKSGLHDFDGNWIRPEGNIPDEKIKKTRPQIKKESAVKNRDIPKRCSPYGYRWHFGEHIKIKEEQEVLKIIKKMRDKGSEYLEIAKYLTKIKKRKRNGLFFRRQDCRFLYNRGY